MGALGLVALVVLGYVIGVAVSRPAEPVDAAREAQVEAPDQIEAAPDLPPDDEGAFEARGASEASEIDEGQAETPSDSPPRTRRRRRPRSGGGSGSKLWEW